MFSAHQSGIVAHPAFAGHFHVFVGHASFGDKSLVGPYPPPLPGHGLLVDSLDHFPAGRKAVSYLQIPVCIAQPGNMCLPLVDKDSHAPGDNHNPGDNAFQLVPLPADDIEVVHVPPVPFAPANNLRVVVNRRREEDPDILAHLVAYVHALWHELFPGLLHRRYVFVILHAVELYVHAPGVFLVRHVAYVHPERPQDFVQQPVAFLADLRANPGLYLVMPDIVVVFAEVHEPDIPFVVPVFQPEVV